MDGAVNLAEKLALLDQPYSPGIVGYLNDHKLAVVKVKGEFVWHEHDDTDDFFLVLRGRLTIQLRDRDVEQASDVAQQDEGPVGPVRLEAHAAEALAQDPQPARVLALLGHEELDGPR